jgi:hypothetical protein
MNGVDAETRAAILAARASARDIILHWRDSPAHRAVEAVFTGCMAEDASEAMRRASDLLGDTGRVAALLQPLLDALTKDPLFEPPFRTSRDAMRVGAVLFEGPAVTLSACVTSAAAMRKAPPAASCTFTGRRAVTRYLRAGGASLRRWRTGPIGSDFRADTAPRCIEQASLRLMDGVVLAIDGRTEAQLLTGATSDVVTLVATARATAPLMREHAIADGRLLRIASGDERASRTEMLLAFLRLSGRADAGARFEQASREPAFHLRWAAMREWLALDARAAFPRLEAMAVTDPHAEVRAAAQRTLETVRRKLAAACPA